MPNKIYLSPPCMNGSELDYVKQAFETNWIAPLGENVDLLESSMEAYFGCRYAAALSSGTAAIHMALKCLGVGAGDRVFCSDVTFAGSCNPILYQGAVPVFIDSDSETWNMSPDALEHAFEDARREGRLPKAVIIVDLYGIPAEFDRLLPICEHYGVPVIEDAAEALGATYHGIRCGSFGKMSVLSFNANKIITTSGGGMLLCEEKQWAEKAKFWASQSREPVRHYEHREVGYNYRLSNILAGIGCGQLRTLEEYVEKRRYINLRYRKLLEHLPVGFEPTFPGARSNCWLTVMTIHENCRVTVTDLISALGDKNIESRAFWKPMHCQPVFSSYPFYPHREEFSAGEQLFASGICLPSGTALTDGDIERVAAVISACFEPEPERSDR